MGLTRVELVTSSLSGTRSNQLSYKPGGFFGREAEHFVVVYVGFNLARKRISARRSLRFRSLACASHVLFWPSP